MDPAVSLSSAAERNDARLLAGLRAALQAAEFTAERIESELGSHALGSRPAEVIVERHRLGEEGTFAALARLFLLGDSVAARQLEPALEPLGVHGLAELGLCVVDRDRVRATAKLVPHGDYILACDLDAPTGAGRTFAYVPGVQAPSVTLAKLAVRTRCDSALDLGTGMGLQALLAARHCDSVVASDINTRALGFAAFNARLNTCHNVELRHGRGFEPVAGSSFDLIVSNPPYVISPDRTYAYRDGEVSGDLLCRQIIREAPRHLNDGGFAHILVSWPHAVDGDWDAPLTDWVSGTGCDAWLLHYRTSDPLAHATGWLSPLADDDPTAFEAALDRWLAYLSERHIPAIGYGAIILRRRPAARNWIASAQLPLEQLQPASDHIIRVFGGNDLVNTGEDEQLLLEERLRLTPRHRVRQTLLAQHGDLELHELLLELTDGLGFSVGIDRYTALLLPRLDGAHPLADALDDTAAQLKLTDEARHAFRMAAAPVVRRLLELGFLEREGGRA